MCREVGSRAVAFMGFLLRDVRQNLQVPYDPSMYGVSTKLIACYKTLGATIRHRILRTILLQPAKCRPGSCRATVRTFSSRVTPHRRVTSSPRRLYFRVPFP